MKHGIPGVLNIRNFLAVSILIFAANALSTAAFAASERTESGRAKLLMDFNWKFHLGDAPDAGTNFDYPEVKDLAKTKLDELGQEGELENLSNAVSNNVGGDVSFVQTNFDDSHWWKLNLPDDWAVGLPFDEKADYKHGFKPVGPGFPQNSIAWYRKEFKLPKSDEGKILWLEFDGVYRNSLVWLNGHCLGRHLDGYSSFRYDISQFANYGEKNVLVVRVDASKFEGWFYEGAGIYRHVWLEKTSPVSIAPDGIFVWTQFSNDVPEGSAGICIQSSLLNSLTNSVRPTTTFEIINPEGKPIGKIEKKFPTDSGFMRQWEFKSSQPLFTVASPQLWSPENPKLYKLITTVENDGKIVDQKETEFGIRTIAFDTTNGFLLNGKPYTIKGTCNHQDHAGVGSAIPDALQYWRVAKLKEMGCNAIRTSHNAPTPELLDACDRLGMLVMDENRRMDTNDFELTELKSQILRDRNHPSVFIWSLGNEEGALQGGKTNADEAREIGAAVTTAMQNLAHQLDPTHLCTVAMNGGWGYGISTIIDVQGFNYHTANIDNFHARFPTQPEIGTEVASTIGTRGIYTNDTTRGYVNADGSQKPGWGASPWEWWPFYVSHSFTSGGFVWTGFDYRGEPTPYKWPCVNSHFGIMDMCGFPKDIYYYYQSWWQNEPVLHISPHWNWPDKIGQEIPVRIFSNCKQVELFLNGKSLGRQTMQTNSYLDWKVNYAPGVLEAKGYDTNGKLILETKDETTGTPAAIQLSPDRTKINADGQDCSIINVAVVDSKGRVVPTAGNLIHFESDGPGKIIGVGNGDPSCHEPDQCESDWQRSAFNGYAQVIVQTTRDRGTIKLTASSEQLKKAVVKISTKRAAPSPFVP